MSTYGAFNLTGSHQDTHLIAMGKSSPNPWGQSGLSALLTFLKRGPVLCLAWLSQQNRLVLRQWAEALLMHFFQSASWQEQILNSSGYWSKATSQLTPVSLLHATAFWGCSCPLLLIATENAPAGKSRDLMGIPVKCLIPSANLGVLAASPESWCGSCLVCMTCISMEVLNIQVLSSCHGFLPSQH